GTDTLSVVTTGDAIMIFTRSEFVKVLNRFHCERERCCRPRYSGGRGCVGASGSPRPSTTRAAFFKRPPRNITTIIDMHTAAATAESVRFTWLIQSHFAPHCKTVLNNQ